MSCRFLVFRGRVNQVTTVPASLHFLDLGEEPIAHLVDLGEVVLGALGEAVAHLSLQPHHRGIIRLGTHGDLVLDLVLAAGPTPSQTGLQINSETHLNQLS